MLNNLNIGRHAVGRDQPVFVIAEAGVNHNGDPDLARRLIRAAKECGADCVKFQTYKAERVVTPSAPKADYQLESTDPLESQFRMLKQLELPESVYPDLIAECARCGILFMSTPYSLEDAQFLNRLDVPAYKIASGQIVELTFLRAIGAMGKPIILSTGMATMEEIGQAVKAIRDTGNERIVLLQCTTNYPSAVADANLRAMKTIENEFGVMCGYSDHTQGNAVSLAAVALGAPVIEKHFTLDRKLPGPDHSSSANPAEFGILVQGIRDIEKALGDGVKRPTEAELRNSRGMRRSIVAALKIAAGEAITNPMLTFKRPGTGISPARLDEVIGRKASEDIAKDAVISFDQLL